MKKEYTLRNNTTLKCSACGNGLFEEKRVEIGAMTPLPSRECWEYICSACTHVMVFVSKATRK